MDPELTHAITIIIGALLGTGGLYGVNRLRNGNGTQPQQGQEQFVRTSVCDAHHADITDALHKGGTKMDTLSEEVTTLTIAVNKVISDSDNKAIGAARDERDAHENRYHAKG